jgi:hypothetical protein
MALLGEHLAQFLAIVMVCILSVTILRRVVNFARRMRQYIRDKFTKKRRNSAKPDPWEVSPLELFMVALTLDLES